MKGVCSVLPDKQVTKKEKKELLLQVEKQLDELMKSGEDINFQILSRKLGIARSTLYRNTSVRQMVIAAREDRKIPSDILTRIQENNRELEDRVFKLEKKVMELERSLDSN
jgi:BMFP domain-containing protein YqiC